MMLAMYRVRLLMLREWYRVRTNLFSYALNNVVLWPVFFALSIGYFSALALFGEQGALKGTEMFLGVALLHTGLLAFGQTVPLLKERFGTHMVQYHVSVTSFSSMFFARFIFSVLAAFTLYIPYLPIAKLVLGGRFYTDKVSWLQLLCVQAVIIFFMVSYVYFWMGCLASMRRIGSVWKRAIEPMMWLGGLWAPGYAIIAAFPQAQSLIIYNPFYYATEAIRQVFLHDSNFVPLTTSCSVLLGAGVVFSILSYFLLRHRLQML